jgi:hypothetical protein
VRTALLSVGLAAALLMPAAGRTDDDDAGPRLRLYGFGDINYSMQLSNNHQGSHGAVYVGNLNLFLDGQLGPRVRTLTEVRLSYNPSSTTNSTTVSRDYATGGSVIWGGIVIERAWVEYAFSDRFTLRTGEFLTPYGIWNVDHGSPTLLGNTPPTSTSIEMFPRQQVGLEAYGSQYLGATRLGYHLTVSNGRIGDNPPYKNLNGLPGFGGRVFVENEALGSLRVGLSGYSGRYTRYTTSTSYTADPITGNVAATSSTNLSAQYDERTVGADVSWKWKRLALNAEVIAQRYDYTAAGLAVPAMPGRTVADYTRAGGYATLAYELPWLGLTPWILFDTYRSDLKSCEAAHNLAPGLDLRLRPDFVVKVQIDHIYSTGTRPRFRLNDLTAQVAYAF